MSALALGQLGLWLTIVFILFRIEAIEALARRPK